MLILAGLVPILLKRMKKIMINTVKAPNNKNTSINEAEANHFKMAGFLYDIVHFFVARRKYHKASSLKHKRIFKENLKNYKNMKILDLACGTGASISFLDRENHYTGLDLSPSMLRRAAKKADKKKFLSVQIINDNCSELNFDENFFDIIIMDTALHLLKDYESSLLETLRVLKKGGFFICAFPCMGINSGFDKSWEATASIINACILNEKDIKMFFDKQNVKYSKTGTNGGLLYFKIEKL